MQNSRITLTLFLALATAILGGCGTLDQALRSAPKPSARIVSTELQNFSLNSLDLVFDIEITNPYGVSLPLLGLDYVLGSGELQLLQGGVDTHASVPANGSTVIQVPARLEFATVIRTLAGVRPGAILPYHAEINVAVDAPLIGPMDFPLRHEGDIPIPAVPDITLVSFNIDAMTWEQVRGTAKLKVTNTNEFELQPAKFDFNLAMGQQTLASIELRGPPRLAPGQTAMMEIPISFSPQAFGAGITGIFDLLDGVEADYDISGSLDVGTQFGPLSIPFSQGGETFIRR